MNTDKTPLEQVIFDSHMVLDEKGRLIAETIWEAGVEHGRRESRPRNVEGKTPGQIARDTRYPKDRPWNQTSAEERGWWEETAQAVLAAVPRVEITAEDVAEALSRSNISGITRLGAIKFADHLTAIAASRHPSPSSGAGEKWEEFDQYTTTFQEGDYYQNEDGTWSPIYPQNIGCKNGNRVRRSLTQPAASSESVSPSLLKSREDQKAASFAGPSGAQLSWDAAQPADSGWEEATGEEAKAKGWKRSECEWWDEEGEAWTPARLGGEFDEDDFETKFRRRISPPIGVEGERQTRVNLAAATLNGLTAREMVRHFAEMNPDMSVFWGTNSDNENYVQFTDSDETLVEFYSFAKRPQPSPATTDAEAWQESDAAAKIIEKFDVRYYEGNVRRDAKVEHIVPILREYRYKERAKLEARVESLGKECGLLRKERDYSDKERDTLRQKLSEMRERAERAEQDREINESHWGQLTEQCREQISSLTTEKAALSEKLQDAQETSRDWEATAQQVGVEKAALVAEVERLNAETLSNAWIPVGERMPNTPEEKLAAIKLLLES